VQEGPKTSVYRVHTPLVTQARQDGGRTEFMAIPRGSLMLVSGDLGSLGLVDVEYKGKRLAVYRRDIEERAEKMAES
jgi:hypothetical protein